MDILGSVFISALAASLFVYVSPLLSTEVQPGPTTLPQNSATNSDVLFGVDAFYGRPHTKPYIREIVPSPPIADNRIVRVVTVRKPAGTTTGRVANV
jgi:hypothetical protein